MSRQEVVKVIERPDQIRFGLAWVQQMVEKGLAGGPVQISLGRKRRSKDQNKKLWPMLTDISRQVEWYGEKLSPEDWKHMLTASLTKQRAVPGIDGGFVVLGLSTSKMNKALFSQLIEVIYAFGAERGVQWSEKASQSLYELRNVE